jgi:vacuolar-type H+-ATPase subunit E/Vma4
VTNLTIEEKIAHLQTAAMEDARKEGNSIIEKHRKAHEKVFEMHRVEALRQSETRIQAEVSSAKQQVNMAASRAQLELKRELGEVRMELRKKLFAEVDQLLEEYMDTEEYKTLLVKYIEKACKAAGNEELEIYINSSDEDIKAFLEKETNTKLIVSNEDFIGGIQAIIPARNILVDYSFKSSYETAKRDFLFNVGGAGID